MIVCVCKVVSDRDIKKAIQQGASSMRALREQLGVATCCGRCACAVREILDEHTEIQPAFQGQPLWQPAR